MTLRKRIEKAINETSAENGSNTPDYVLAEYLMDCLEALDKAVNARDEHSHSVAIANCSRCQLTPHDCSLHLISG
jgi:hypothetical protein